jgi:rhodanese-related sulfurtransferase
MSCYTSISVDKLSRLIDTAAMPALIDVRIDEDFAESPRLIPRAVRWPHANTTDWAPAFVGKPAIVICQKGKQLSEGVAAWPSHAGSSAEVLEALKPGRQQSIRPSLWQNCRRSTSRAEQRGLHAHPQRSIASPAHGCYGVWSIPALSSLSWDHPKSKPLPSGSAVHPSILKMCFGAIPASFARLT